jgi:hypothetical protein
METLLATVNNILPEIGFPTLTSVIGNSNQTAVQALAAANRAGRQLARKPWRILVKRHTFNTVSSAESYVLPSDHNYFVHNTEWNTSNTEFMSGPLSDERWQADLSGLITTTVNDRFQVRAAGNNDRFHIRPIPTAVEEISYFYVNKNWNRSASGVRQDEWKSDTDVLLLDQESYELDLKWRILRLQRREFQHEQAEAIRVMNTAFARDGGMKTYRILGPIEDNVVPGRVPETGFGS